MTGDLSDRELQAFRRDGAVALRGVFAEWLEVLRAGVGRNMAEPGPYTKEYSADDSTGYFFGDYCNWQRIPEFRSFLLESPAAAIAGALMGSKTARLFHEHVLVKEPGTEEATPWHHDLPYYCVEGTMSCSLWIPLDAVAREICPEFVAGSHRWGKRFMPRKFIGIDYDRPGEALEPVPDIDGHREDYRILSWALEPGDAIAFTYLTLHGAPPNLSTNRRRGFVARWLGEDMVFALRSGEVSPPFPELVGVLEDGDPLPDDLFPVVARLDA